MKIQAVHHVAIICSNYEVSKHFYKDILGFEMVAETYRTERQSYKLDLRVGVHTQIELFSFPNPPTRVSRPEACGLRHLAFGIYNLNDAVTELQAQHVVVEPIRVDEFTQRRFTFFSDPDGLPLELYEIEKEN